MPEYTFSASPEYVGDPTKPNQFKMLEQRVKELAERKITVGELPIKGIQTKLAEIPQDPNQVLLPGSIGIEAMQEGTLGSMHFCSAYILGSGEVYENVGDPIGVVTVGTGGYFEVTYKSPFNRRPMLTVTSWNGGNIAGNIVVSDAAHFRWDGYNTVNALAANGFEFIAIGPKGE